MVTFAIGRQTDDDSIEVNVIVLDENEAPVIDVTVDSVTVWENASIDFVIFTFNVTDPDAIIANGSAAYKNITNVSLVLGGEFSFLFLRGGLWLSVLSVPQPVCLT